MTGPGASMRRPSRRVTGAAGAAGLGAVVLLIAGCGGSSTPGVAHLGANAAATSKSAESGGSGSESKAAAQAKLVEYAKCMRANGVPQFPEPVEGAIELKGGPGSSLNPESSQFKAAEAKCHKLMPEGGKPSPQQQKQAEERALKVSACMRSHGVPNFPEPEFGQGGGVRLHLKAGPGGLDPHSPQFQAAAKACAGYFGPKGGPAVAFGPLGAGKAPPPGAGSGAESSQQSTP
jgi:hypothetical protein